METLRAILLGLVVTATLFAGGVWFYFDREAEVFPSMMSDQNTMMSNETGTFEFQTMSGRWAEAPETDSSAGDESESSSDTDASPASSDDLISFAQCLTDQGLTMYGAYWCPHCSAQKDLFGSAFSEINYVECAEGQADSQPERCVAAEIEAYPTWIDASGTPYVGGHTLEELGTIAGCVAP